ncbi:DNA polymerase Y family protein [Methylobacterium sp.]|uniref:DNA polymerase Y family protein n=1 Tax=Methylobacterium sp. TaxID=409 RepID=UPI003C732200
MDGPRRANREDMSPAAETVHTPMRTLYIDMNSFFASVEQQLAPELRGWPVGILALGERHDPPHRDRRLPGALVAASYEAKAFGVKTGTLAREAVRLCPEIVLLPSRHRLYVRFNTAIAGVIDRIAELERIRSVDEFQVALGGETAILPRSLALAREIKAAIAAEVGSELRLSAGIGPNPLLAKIAGKLQKPDGLSWLAPENMPARVAHLGLDDLPGIARGILSRLLAAGVSDIPALYGLDPRHARMIWRSVEGERFVRSLQGLVADGDSANPPTQRSGFGNGKVLSPERRRPDQARLVLRWLTERAAARLRRAGYCAAEVSLTAFILPEEAGRFRSWGRSSEGVRWWRTRRLHPSQETAVFLAEIEVLWCELVEVARPPLLLSVGVHLAGLVLLSERTGDLFLQVAPGERTSGERLSRTIDALNRRFGDQAVTYGINAPHPGFYDRG